MQWIRGRWPHRRRDDRISRDVSSLAAISASVWLLPLGATLVLSGNVVRLSLLILIGAYVNPDLADNGFHSKAGWVLFCGIALALAAAGHRSRYFSRVGADRDDAENPTAGYLLPLLSQVAASLLFGALTTNAELAYTGRIVAGAVALVVYRRELGVLRSPGSFAPFAASVVGIVVAVVWLRAAPDGFRVPAATAQTAGPTAVFVLVHLLGSVLVAPLCEEMAMRGFLLRRLIAKDFVQVPFECFTLLAVGGSSLGFGLLHERWLVATFAGVAYAVAQIRSGRLSDAVVAHAVTNAAIAAWVLATGDASHWT